MEDVKEVAIGYRHSAALKTDGSLWMWGENLYNQLGNGELDDQIKPVKIMEGVESVLCSEDSSAAIKTDGSLWMWGDNEYGQLSEGEKVMDVFQAFPR
jgi:hypothetical protein